MKTVLKSCLSLGMAAALPVVVMAEEAGACPASKNTCPVSGVSADACCPATGAGKPVSADSKLTRVEYKVAGMTCGACETKLATALKAINGVAEVSACAESKLAKVSYDPAKLKDDKALAAAIGKAGFTVQAATLAVKVDGMTCGACSDKVGKKLAALKGVTEQKVCHESKLAVVTYDPAKLSRKDILAAIDATGFKAVQ